MANVIAAIDLSQLGRRVVERARMLAEQWDTGLTVLHATDTPREALIGDAIAAMVRSHREERARDVVEWCRTRTRQSVELATMKGSPTWEIVQAAKNADLAVLGSSSVEVGRSGPVTRRVAEMARTDVLVVKRQPRVPYRKVVVAVDLSAHSRHAVDRAIHLAPDAEITLVFVLPTNDDVLMGEAGMFPEEVDLNRRNRMRAANEMMESFTGRWDGRVRGQVVDGLPIEMIDETLRRRSADLAVVASRGAGATRMVLLGTVAGSVLDAAPCDVLVARVPGEFRRP